MSPVTLKPLLLLICVASVLSCSKQTTNFDLLILERSAAVQKAVKEHYEAGKGRYPLPQELEEASEQITKKMEERVFAGKPIDDLKPEAARVRARLEAHFARDPVLARNLVMSMLELQALYMSIFEYCYRDISELRQLFDYDIFKQDLAEPIEVDSVLEMKKQEYDELVDAEYKEKDCERHAPMIEGMINKVTLQKIQNEEMLKGTE